MAPERVTFVLAAVRGKARDLAVARLPEKRGRWPESAVGRPSARLSPLEGPAIRRHMVLVSRTSMSTRGAAISLSNFSVRTNFVAPEGYPANGVQPHRALHHTQKVLGRECSHGTWCLGGHATFRS